MSFDAVSSSGEISTDPITFAHTCGGSDRLLLVAVFAQMSTAEPTGVTYNSVAMTKIATGLAGGLADLRATLWRLIAPTTGANNIVVTHGSSGIVRVVTGVSYKAIDQANPISGLVEDYTEGNDPAVDVSSATGELVVDFLSHWGNTPVVGAGQTQRGSTPVFGPVVSDEPGATTVTMSWTAGGDPCGHVALSLKHIAGYASATISVVASGDDAQQVGGTVTINGTTIGGDLDATTDYAGMRFLSTGIPQGATILTSKIRVVPASSALDEPLVTIFFEDADAPAIYTTAANSISSRAKTSGVAWSNTNLGADGATYFDSPDLTAICQAVVNRAGFNGNLNVIIQGGATGTRDLSIEAYDLGPGTNPPRLVVEWVVTAAPYPRSIVKSQAVKRAATW